MESFLMPKNLGRLGRVGWLLVRAAFKHQDLSSCRKLLSKICMENIKNITLAVHISECHTGLSSSYSFFLCSCPAFCRSSALLERSVAMLESWAETGAGLLRPGLSVTRELCDDVSRGQSCIFTVLMALCRFFKKCNWETYTPIKKTFSGDQINWNRVTART